MKVKKQLRRLKTMLDDSQRNNVKSRDELKALLSKMKSKERHLVKKMSIEKDEKVMAHLEKEVAMLHAQRKKGIKVLKELSK